MSSPAQKRATQNYRNRLVQKGITRFEVQASEADHALIRAMARRLADGGLEAERARLILQEALTDKQAKTSGAARVAKRPPSVEKKPDFGDLFGEG